MIKKRNQLIVGTGFIARKFRKYSNFLKKKDVVVYAAGISNSTEKNVRNLSKEVASMKKFLSFNKKKLIYISSYSVCDSLRSKNKYVKNKIKIEKLIESSVSEYIILRLPEIVGFSKNPYTLTNFFSNMILKGKSFEVYKGVRRNILDIDHAIHNCIKFIKFNSKKKIKINLLNKDFYEPKEIVENLEKILKIRGHYKIKKIKKNNFKTKNSLYLKFNQNYLFKVLKKYYG